MDRLTKRVDGIVVLESWAVNKDPVSIIQRLCSALAAYEDKDLEPQDIISAVDMAKIACALYELNAYKDLGSIEHLRELIQAEQDGRLLVLPCKVGDTIWRIKCFADWPDIGKPYVEADAFLYRDIHYFGKTVFLTREEAEAALAGKGGKG